MVWVLLFLVYGAPPNAVDWDGPWDLMMTQTDERRFSSEAECRNAAIEKIGRIHQGVLAPIRFRCVEVSVGLPKGAPR